MTLCLQVFTSEGHSGPLQNGKTTRAANTTKGGCPGMVKGKVRPLDSKTLASVGLRTQRLGLAQESSN